MSFYDTKRLYNLDYLRGLAAFSIMIYHYISWNGVIFTSTDLLGRIGIYGVSIFYILSGLTLYHVYYNKLELKLSDTLTFAKTRFFRIFPLLWFATLLTIIISRVLPSLSTIVLNFTGLFGFVAWDSYIATGAWSIGNELVFYLVFPLFIYLSKKKKILMVLLVAAILIITFYFTFIVLKTNNSLASQWRNYVNPLNQVIFFLCGFYIGHFFQDVEAKNWYYVVALLLASGICVLYPITGDRIALVTGITRIIFILSISIICLACYKLRFNFPIFLHLPLQLLGEMSYSVYLLHPIAYAVIFKICARLEHYGCYITLDLKILISVVTTLIVSFLTYKYFEKFFINIGRRKLVLKHH